MWSILFFFTYFTNFPSGTYYGKVNIPIVAKQEVYVTFHENSSGNIQLKGPITQHDVFYYYKNNICNPILGEKLSKTLRFYKCKMLYIEYDKENDVANVALKVPLLGKAVVKMQKKNHMDIDRINTV